ncbi:MAG: DNA-binding protein WhiA [Eubacterium sp.]|nr:DNA-binding protein WhiA [Eubacterium sp.]
MSEIKTAHKEYASFAAEVRAELADHISKAGHCRRAELRAFFESCMDEEQYFISDESLTIIEKCNSLVEKEYHIKPEIEKKHHTYTLSVSGMSRIKKSLGADEVLERTCCKKAYLRGWFLSSGTVTDPEGHYHLEIVTRKEDQAERIRAILKEFDISAKLTHRKNRPVVYLKEGQKVVDFLNIVGAHVALMEFENARIVKEVRGKVNRIVNCETANIKKTISASSRQVSDIELLMSSSKYDDLSESLKEIAQLRLDHPDATLAELGQMLDPPIAKSAVNHRMRRLIEAAGQIR